MRIRITARGIYGAQGEIPIGTEVDVREEPKGWAGRYEVITPNAKPEAVAIVNPAPEPEPDAPRRGRPRKEV